MLHTTIKQSLVCIILLVYFRYVQPEIVCELAAFIEDEDGKNPQLIDSGRTRVDLDSCDVENQNKCKSFVEKQVIEGTKGGNFSLPSDDQDMYTVGDILCDKADAVEENVQHKYVQIYWKLCNSSWKKTSFKMPEPLCCDDGLYVACKFKK